MGTLCHNFITATATLFLIVFAAHLCEVESSGIFELDLVSFENRGGRDYLGGCCSGRSEGPFSTRCQGTCPVYLRVCVKHYQATVEPDSACTFYEFSTPVLNETSQLSQQHNMSFDLKFTWPGQFTLIVEAWHPTARKGGNKILVARFIAQRALQIGADWTEDRLTSNESTLDVLYRVYCAENYYGPKCESLCRPRNDKFGHYTCGEDGGKLCRPGWTGIYCERAVCLPGCHHEHGTCDQPNECKCRHGWEGQYCNSCIRYPGCSHGTCDNPWQCNCDEGWGGLFCDQDLNYCTNHKPCKNGGTCTNTGQGSYTCSCSEEYMGEDCDVLRNPCEGNPCRNNGICKNPSSGEYECECRAGFFGPHCETSASICTDNLCENGGSCVQDPSGFICSCPQGFSGVLCEKIEKNSCIAGYCLNGGTCIELSSGFYCHCPPGLTGERCENIVTCSSSTCKNGGTCSEHLGIVKCKCLAGFSGSHCQIRQKNCSSKPCANGGECRDLYDGYHCDCKPGFGGKDCKQLLNPCSSSPCLNGALCHETAHSFVCRCSHGYVGVRCQVKASGDAMDNRPSIASNVSHRVSSEEDLPLSGSQVALIASLSTVLPMLAILLCCVVYCVLRRRQRQPCVEEPQRAKEYDFDVEDEQLQNELNAMHMNNKHNNMPQKIVNALDRVPAKVTNEAPPKVLNIDVSNRKVPDKSLVCTPRTLEKKDNTNGGSISCHHPAEWPPSSTGGIYVIEDHFRSCPEPVSAADFEDILATEV
ncbi:delta-like protein C [Uloborus diversus]|uniref:delta-like protein C n=1 Tax=Uloborus diversus TaxID=327109 RepID=UPI00240A8E21|nr:delta-like protein C [Uloborus diversus]